MPQNFAQLGALFNQTTDELIGGVSPFNQHQLLQQLTQVQNGVQALVNNGAFTDPLTITHAQNVADQINFLTNQIATYGTNTGNIDLVGGAAFNPKFINDVQRDIQDIVQGDPNLAALAAPTHGFQQTSNLLAPPTPFADSTGQHDFLVNFGLQSNALGAQAVADVGGNPAAIANDIANLHAFQAANEAFAVAQPGLYQARFQNELANNSVAFTATNELVKALQTGDHALAQGAATVLSQNAMDVQGNNSFNGIDIGTGLPVQPVVNGGIPASIPDVATAGAVFNDATTKIIGGVAATNQKSIVADLQATSTGLHNAIANQGLTGQALQDANTVIGLLDHGATIVAGLDTANPTQVSFTNAVLNAGQAAIVHIVNNDATLAGLANGGFTPNPPGTHQHQNQFMAMNEGQQGQDQQGLADLANMTHTVDLSHMWHHA